MNIRQKIYGLYTMIILCMCTCYGADKKAILNEILTNPTSLLLKNWTVYKQFSQEAMPPYYELPAARNTVQELIQKHEQTNPVFMLKECLCPLLSRVRNPNYRTAFENAILTEYNKKLRRKNPITCISFASGGGFQDLVILCKIINQNPYAMIHLHMLDPEYTHYINTKQKEKLPRLMSLDQEAFLYEDTNLYTEIGYRYQQMLKFLEDSFPQATIRLYSHKGITDFFKYAEMFNIMQDIDLIYTADINDFEAVVSDYKLLCAKALKVNKNVINIDLSKDIFPYLLRYSLTPFNKGSSETIKADDEETITLYSSMQTIDWLSARKNFRALNRKIARFLQNIRRRFG